MKIEKPGTTRAAAEDDAFASLGSNEAVFHDRLVHFSAFLKGAAWQREQDAQICEHYVDQEGKNQAHWAAKLIREQSSEDVGVKK